MRTQGFNLLELLIVMALMALLMTIAYPNYQDCLHKARYQNAKVELSHLQAAMALYYSQHGSYLGASLPDLGFKSPITGYHVALRKIETEHYLIQAEAIGPQASDRYKNLTMTEGGFQAAEASRSPLPPAGEG